MLYIGISFKRKSFKRGLEQDANVRQILLRPKLLVLFRVPLDYFKKSILDSSSTYFHFSAHIT